MAYERWAFPQKQCSQPFGNCLAGNSDATQGRLVGLVAHCFMYEPLTNSYFDQKAAERTMLFNVGYCSPNVLDAVVEELLNDFKRIEFHQTYLALAEAIKNGADVRGYFIWSLMDNYEWNYGYKVRFGLHYVDRKTYGRIPKLSARWYQEFLKNNSLVDVPSIRSRKSLLISY
ncbi:hypothetical protein M8C21_029143 [Ambrosia artemisiifolia]|uniref:Uncharacterized protein n=1 Tax=Ambrosia artemisiifolia TaxID=4212 RepID=A0AAD5GVQ2_AMBAR|nr:hypothetical protein M8C21_029143 [Ambrosia artemisiifolia]